MGNASMLSLSLPQPILIVLLLVVASGGVALCAALFFVSVSWLSERLHGRLGTEPPAAGSAADLLGDGPILAAFEALTLGRAATFERELRAALTDLFPGEPRARTLIALGYLLAATGCTTEASGRFVEALGEVPALAPTVVDLAALAARYEQDEAAELALAAVLATPAALVGHSEKAGLAYHLYGQLLTRQRRYTEAEAQLRQAVALRPDDPVARNNFGAALEAVGKPADALAQYREGVRLAPQHSAAHTNLGGLLLRAGQYDEARDHLRIAANLAPERPTAHMNLSALHARLGQWSEAEREAGMTLALRPDTAVAHLTLARARLHLGRSPEAEQHLRRALEIAPENAQAHALLGYLLTQQGSQIEAQLHLEQACTLTPDIATQFAEEAAVLDTLGLVENANTVRACAEVLAQTALRV